MAAWTAHLAVTDLGTYVTVGPVGLPLVYDCKGRVWVKTDTGGGVFTVADFRSL